MSIYGLLGRNISYSFSQNYFTKKFTNEGIKGAYQNFDIPTIEALPDILKNTKIKGLNVTIPYKQEVIPVLDHLDPIAKEIGAVNVIKFNTDGTLTGYNSDYYGFTTSLKALPITNVTHALILGTGGASKAIAYALQNLGIKYTFVSRTPSADRLSYADLSETLMKQATLIINCTPLGTFPDTDRFPDISYNYLNETHILYDLIYNPEETTFMKKGKARGATVSNGLQMLIHQAEKAWEIWNNTPS